MKTPRKQTLEEALQRLADERRQDLTAANAAPDRGDVPDLRQAFENHMAAHTPPTTSAEPRPDSAAPGALRFRLLRAAPYVAAAAVLLVAAAAWMQSADPAPPVPPTDLGPMLSDGKIKLLAVNGNRVTLQLGSGDTDDGYFYYEVTVDADGERVVGPLTVEEDVTTIEIPGASRPSSLHVRVRLLEDETLQGERDRWEQSLPLGR